MSRSARSRSRSASLNWTLKGMAIMRRQIPSDLSLIGGSSLQAKISRAVGTMVSGDLNLRLTWSGSPDTSSFSRPSSILSIRFMSLAMLASLPIISMQAELRPQRVQRHVGHVLRPQHAFPDAQDG